MNKNQKLAIAISSGFAVVILGVLSLISSANVGEKTKQNALLLDGGGTGYGPLKGFWEFDPNGQTPGFPAVSGVWNQKADFAGSTRMLGVGFSIGNKGYVSTGYYSGPTEDVYLKDLWEWNGDTNFWTQKSNMPAIASPRSAAVGFSIDRKGYVGTGNWSYGLSNNRLNDFWEWNGDIDDANPLTGYNTWTKKANVPGSARGSAVGFSIANVSDVHNKGYIGTGSPGDANYMTDFYEWDQVTDKWKQVADFAGGGTAHAVGFSIGNKGYVGTGTGASTGKYKKDFWEFDPNGYTPGSSLPGKWNQRADLGGIARTVAVGFSAGLKGYIGTGIGATGRLKDFWEFDPFVNLPMGKWTQRADYAGGAIDYAIGFSIRNKGYIVTGEGYNANECQLDSWKDTLAIGFGAGRSGAVGFSIGGKGYVGTGLIAGSQMTKDFWEYDSSTHAWTQKADVGGAIGLPRTGAVGFSLQGKGYIGTGLIGENLYTADFWGYDPNSNVWKIKTPFGGGARAEAVGISTGDKAYIGTGSDSNLDLKKDLWQFNPDGNTLGFPSGSGSWTKKADFGGVARLRATGFALDGKIYLGTGWNSQSLQDFWEYNPATTKWTKKADFGGGAVEWATGFSVNNKGYIGTGWKDNNLFLKEFWSYDPATDTWIKKADFPGSVRVSAVGFSLVNNHGYIGTGSGTKDFWEYCPD